jgi:hypothetical protein
MLGNLGFDDVGVRRGGRLAEIDLDHATAVGVRRRKRLHRIADPARGRLREIEIAIAPVNHALASERGQPLVDLFPDGAEFRIGGVTQRQHAEFDPIKTRRTLAHQFVIDTDGSRRRLTFAPGGGDHHEPLSGGQNAEIKISHVDDRRLEPFARGLGECRPASFSEFPDSVANDRQGLG